ncbi:bestrophin-like domain [Roseicella frigidaeris]|uniref:DUF4239 domain-containing protein n=1 Tax=Roseicella frigidaeris TaxID=2230885 RepID=A0A327MDG3_9PROT|nr:DUF4239 domain-containing protein [Roseicella frigidaeris]RAI60362.1 hypothetical protein DOO78_04640 [Roseicella frigidaeris]
MSALGLAAIALGLSLLASLLGLWLRSVLPAHHLEAESREAMHLVLALVASMAALVLGLLVNTAQGVYRNQGENLLALAADLVTLDRVLLRYGPAAQEVRLVLRQDVRAEFGVIMTADGVRSALMLPAAEQNLLEPLNEALRRLQPGTQAQRHDLDLALDLAEAITRTRTLMAARQESALPGPFLGVLLFWLTILFLGFGLLARPNPTVAASMLIGALAVASALFLIIELDRPFDGLMHLSNAPLQAALRAIDPR